MTAGTGSPAGVDSSRMAWVNGTLVPESAAVVSAFDHGLTVGDGVFETTKVLDGVPFALGRHLDRLRDSAEAMALPAPDLDAIREAVSATLAAQPGEVRDVRLRITYTGGTSPLGSERGDAGPTTIVAVAPLAARGPSSAVVTVPWPRNERGALAGVKTTSYGENVIALARAKSLGASEAVFADTTGRLCEGTGSNVFLELDGRLVTPTLATGCLAGVTRALVLAWCDAVEADVPIEALLSTSEVFLTSSTRDVHPVHSVDGRRLDVPGPLTTAAMTAFALRAGESSEP